MKPAIKLTFALLFGLVVLLSGRQTLSSPTAEDPGIPAGIAWYGVLADGLAEAQRTGKPILLVSAAPQCAGVPGMW